MDPSPVSVETTRAPQLFLKPKKTAVKEAVEDVTYGSVSRLPYRQRFLIASF